MIIRRGKEFYGSKYEEAMKLFKEGVGIKEIAARLGISYSTAYHWIRGIRKPEQGNVNEFLEYIRIKGPSSALQVMQKFPKHNELFLIASRRGLGMKRTYLGKKYRELATWYYLEGQEELLDARVAETRKKVEELKNRLRSTKELWE
jgi:DNA-binding CsgD family transcriptional regulator